MNITQTRWVVLKYDGKWDWFTGDQRQWTIMSDYYDRFGRNRKGGSLGLAMLKEIGVVPS